MAGTALRNDSTKITLGYGTLWANVAVPAAAARITLDAATGTPDSVANPLAIHLGHTADGITMVMNSSKTDYFVDETPFPVKTTVDQTTLEITGNLVQVFDEEVLKVLSAPFGTYSTAAGYKQVTIGSKASLPYTSFAFIIPTPMDATKFGVLHVYDGINTAGLNVQFGRTVRGQTPFTISARAITSRAQADQIANFWWQI